MDRPDNAQDDKETAMTTPAEPPTVTEQDRGCPVCGQPTGGAHGTPAMAHDCEHPGCVFGPGHSVGYHLVGGQRVYPTPPADAPRTPSGL